MKKYFVIKNVLFNSYYSWNEQWTEDRGMALEFTTKEAAEEYGDANSLGFCQIEEYYHFN
jgi:hypothetical protein